MDWRDNQADRGLQERTGPYQMDGFRHLAKVMVAGSNPVVRSRITYGIRDFPLCR